MLGGALHRHFCLDLISAKSRMAQEYIEPDSNLEGGDAEYNSKLKILHDAQVKHILDCCLSLIISRSFCKHLISGRLSSFDTSVTFQSSVLEYRMLNRIGCKAILSSSLRQRSTWNKSIEISHSIFEGNEEEAAQDDISVTEKSVAEVVHILLDRYDRNLIKVMDSRQCQAFWQKNLASRTPVPPPRRRGRTLCQGPLPGA